MSARLSAKDLVSGQISRVFEVGDEVILIVEVGGRVLQIEAWSDEEGNGAGWLDISVIEGTTSARQVRLAAPGEAV